MIWGGLAAVALLALVPGQLVMGMGGAMHLVAGARRVLVMMEHVTRAGRPKIMVDCDICHLG